MRHFAATAVLVAAFFPAGCATTSYEGYCSKLVSEGYFGSAPEKLMADAERLAQERYSSPEKQDQFVCAYFGGYEEGLKCKYGIVQSGDKMSVSNQGLQAGRWAAIVDVAAGEPKATLEDFGYVPVESKGKLRFEFEKAEFLPEGSGARWWVEYDPAVTEAYDAVRETRDPYEGDYYTFAHFVGLLSPDRGGGVGHFNQYDRELVVTKIVEMRRFKETPNEAIDNWEK